MRKDRKVILYISMSLDGYIADTNDDIDFLSIVEQEGEDYGGHGQVGSVGHRPREAWCELQGA